MKISLRSCMLAALCLISIHPGSGHAEEGKTVPTIVRAFYENNGLPGLSVSIRRGDSTVTYRHGYANLESGNEITDESVFRIASVSKLFTTLGILLLKEQGKLSIDDPLSRYVADFPHGDRITVKNMLQHTSGIPNFSVLEPFSANQAKEWKPGELVGLLREHLKDRPLDFDPGAKAAYSNSNFMLLGVIIEAVSGMAFKDFMAQRVVAPLGMRNTGVGSDTEIVPQRAAGYVVVDGTTTNAQFVSIVAPFATGDFMTQPKELAKISKAFTPGVLLGESTIREMSEPATLKDGAQWIEHAEKFDYSFGYCWELIKPEGKEEWIYTKGGSIDGFFAYVLFFKSAGATVAISSNAQGKFSLLALGLEIGEAMGAIK
jgi:CubicO group peptidase (beta-lactamase class C family)